jgi:death-on-curing family protein
MYYDTIEKSIASIVKCLIKNHCFSDGNKRTATVVFCLLCNLNNIENQIMKNASSIIENIASHNYSVEEVADLLFPNNVISSFLVFKRLKLDD